MRILCTDTIVKKLVNNLTLGLHLGFGIGRMGLIARKHIQVGRRGAVKNPHVVDVEVHLISMIKRRSGTEVKVRHGFISTDHHPF